MCLGHIWDAGCVRPRRECPTGLKPPYFKGLYRTQDGVSQRPSSPFRGEGAGLIIVPAPRTSPEGVLLDSVRGYVLQSIIQEVT